VNHFPEAIARMGEMKTGMGGRLPRIDTAKDHPQVRRQNIVNHVFPSSMPKR
jgi:hypothetical protein